MIFLALGSNLGNRLENFRKALKDLSSYFEITQMTHVIETKALLLPDSPKSWDIPFLNMMIAGNTDLSPQELFARIKETEVKVGRDISAPKWSPRIIDIDIVKYHSAQIQDKDLTIPHVQIPNRDFWKYLLKCLGEKIDDETVNDYNALNYFVINPQIIRIINVTPDSFSDGGIFFNQSDAIDAAQSAYANGASYVELGAQSTRPGFTEISAEEEINRLAPVLKKINADIPLSIDTYQDDVVNFCLDNANVKMINDIRGSLSDNVLKKLANRNVRVVTMMTSSDFGELKTKIQRLQDAGIYKIIIDPGIGFGKNKFENLFILRHFEKLKEFGVPILLAHSRKSFISLFSNMEAKDRDVETIAISQKLLGKYDYLRVHNLDQHMRALVASQILI